MPEKYKCPGCKQFKDVAMFSARPVDERCDVCLPVDQAMVAMDQKVQLAGSKWAAILDGAEKSKSLAPLERMVQTAYEEWGGEHQFVRDGVQWMKDLADNNKLHAAMQHWMGLLKLHAKVDRMRLEDDWRNMDDATAEKTLQAKMAVLMAKMERDQAQQETVAALEGQVVKDY